MCRARAAGGRRCPNCESAAARAAHNDRRRRNRALRTAVVENARAAGIDTRHCDQLAAAPPSLTRDWAADHGQQWSSIDDGPWTLDRQPDTDQAALTDYAALRGEQRTEAMLADLAGLVDQAAGNLRVWLDSMSGDGLRRWSFRNRLLAIAQLQERAEKEGRPELTSELHMRTFKQWKELGRNVAAGEKAIWILAPTTRTIEDEDDHGKATRRQIVVGFRPVPRFNVTQTEGRELPAKPDYQPPTEGDVPPGVMDGLTASVTMAGYTYREAVIERGAEGYTDPKTREVVVDSRLSPAAKSLVLAHELGHIHAGHVDRSIDEYRTHRGQMETEAEAASYLACRQLGVQTKTGGAMTGHYIAGWMHGRDVDFADALDRAVRASTMIVEHVEQTQESTP